MRISRAFLVILCAAACAAIVPREAPAQGHGVITGRVVDERGDPVVNGRVTAWSPDLTAGYRRSRRMAEAMTVLCEKLRSAP